MFVEDEAAKAGARELLFRPFRGLLFFHFAPTGYAVGFILSPLRGLKQRLLLYRNP
jgi:hypothetical protein